MLFYRYSIVGTNGRPVRNASTPVKVHFGLGLIKMNVEEKDNMLSMSAWTRYVSTHVYYIPVHTWGVITVWTFTFGIQKYTTWSKGVMQYSLEMHEK